MTTGDQRCPARGDHALDLTICAARGRGGPLPREQAVGVESDHPIDEVDLVLDLSRGDRRVASVADPRGPVAAPDLAGRGLWKWQAAIGDFREHALGNVHGG